MELLWMEKELTNTLLNENDTAESILSTKPLSEFTASLTTFDGFTGTTPKNEYNDIGWDELKKLVKPEKPNVVADKKHGEYFVPTGLKVANLTGKTLETAQNHGRPTIGKMRSKNHVTTSTVLVYDIDGLDKTSLKKIRRRMKKDGISNIIYTTFSHNKDGLICHYRLLVPIDRQLSSEEYRHAWHGIDKYYFDGQIAEADSSSSNMYQQQGTWSCHPDRQHTAKSAFNDAGIANADFLINIGKSHDTGAKKATPPKIKQDQYGQTDNPTYPPSDANKVAEKCQQIGDFRDRKGRGQSEPLWRDCLGVLSHTENGEELSHNWSSGYDGYDKTETQNKIDSRKKFPPTTCDQFRSTNPKGCENCKHTCHSPITLGWNHQDIVAEMQQQFSILNLNGKLGIVETESLNQGTLALSSKSDAKTLMVRAAAKQFPQENCKDIFDIFLNSPQTTYHSGVEFSPKSTSRNKLNLWIPPTIEPRQGSWETIKNFLLEIICSGDKKAYNYLINYIAHALKKPEEKPGVMIILIAGQGTGKGTLGHILNKIWGKTFLKTNNIDTVTGNFNAAIERSFIVFLDEALFAGNRKASDALKSIVTEPTLLINQKHQPTRQIESCHRFIAATNADHFKNTERDDRRDFTLRVSEKHKGDSTYWEMLYRAIDNGEVEAMVYELLEMDISDINVRDKPDTKELLEQKLMSLNPFAAWWYDCLQQGTISNSKTSSIYDDDNSTNWEDFISTVDTITNIKYFHDGKMYKTPTSQSISKDIQAVCPSAQQKQKTLFSSKMRGYALPSLEACRTEFESWIGSEIKWDKIDIIEDEPSSDQQDECDIDIADSNVAVNSTDSNDDDIPF